MGAKCFAFYYHMNGYNMGDLLVRAGRSLQFNDLRLKLILKGKPGAHWRMAQMPLQDDETSVSESTFDFHTLILISSLFS